MPRDEDFAFWNKAKELRLMTQEQVEECVELLCALELVGSQLRSWDLAVRKGYITREQADEIHKAHPPAGKPQEKDAEPEGPTPEPPPPLEPFVPPPAEKGREEAPGEATPPAGVPAAPQEAETPPAPGDGTGAEPSALEPFSPVGAEAKDEEGHPQQPPHKPGVGLIQLPGAGEDEDDEDAEAVPEEEEPRQDIAFHFADEDEQEAPEEAAEQGEPEPARGPEIGGYQIAAIRSGATATMHPVGSHPMSIGSDASNAVVVQGAEVSPRHARITVGGGKVTIWDMSNEQGMKVNGQACSSAKLNPCDLIQLGEAMLLYLPDYGEDPAPLLTTPTASGGTPFAMLSVLEGPNAGAIFYVSQQPALIGKHKLAGVRIDAPDIDEFHAQLTAVPEGLLIADLASREGVLVNNKPVSRAILKTGDRVALGPATIKVEVLREYAQGAQEAAAPAPPPKETPESPFPAPGAADEGQEAPQQARDDDFALEGQPAASETTLDETSLSAKRPEHEEDWTPELPAEKYGPGDLILTCIEGKSSGTVWKLDKPTMALGRDRHADISVRDLSISRRHAVVVITDEGVEARDLGSRNGIYVNGHKVKSALLKPGDTLRVGQSVFLVDINED